MRIGVRENRDALKSYGFAAFDVLTKAAKLLSALAVFCALSLATGDIAAQQFRHATENFIVVAPDPAFAKKIASEAERFRKELAIEWLDYELPTWTEKCPIEVSIAPHAGGETSFAFMYNGEQRGEPTGWDMKIFGSPERLLDSVLPHEVTHTIFATHFRRPLPRWADEGACTTVEHRAEKQKNHGMLIQFLTSQPSRGIPFNRMFTLRDYPRDILPLYAQGFSVAKFLIMEKGRRHFIDFVTDGMELESQMPSLRAWDTATKKYYGFENLSDLQVRWERWVADGSIEKSIPPNNVMLASRQSAGVNDSASFNSSSGNPPNRTAQPNCVASLTTPNLNDSYSSSTTDENLSRLNEGWYAKQMRVGRRYPPQDTQNQLGNPAKETSFEKQFMMDARLSNPDAGTIWR